MTLRALVTGAGGMLGQDVVRSAADAGIQAIGLTRSELDITDPAAVSTAIARIQPGLVVNCAAWTDVDGAEAAPESAQAVNAMGAGNVARAAHEAGAWAIHISSDYVFDGAKREPYVESDPTGPLSAYGRSKLAGEQAVAAAAPGTHTIVRSSWLFGVHGPCFPATILRLATERDELSVVDDQRGSPTFTGHLAGALLTIGRRRPHGIVHVAGGGSCSWFEFARAIVDSAGSGAEVRPVPTSEMPRPAPRPVFSVLGSERVDGPALPEWREGLKAYMALRSSQGVRS